tara:strand:- start:3862 stop:5568 length:1707 start_codon:yes stop_codon:yes gene_type:complete
MNPNAILGYSSGAQGKTSLLMQKTLDYFGLSKHVQLRVDGSVKNTQLGLFSSKWQWSASMEGQGFGQNIAVVANADMRTQHGPIYTGDFVGDLLSVQIDNINIKLQSTNKMTSDAILQTKINEQVAESVANISNMRMGISVFGRARLLFDRRTKITEDFIIDERCEYVVQKAKPTELLPADILKAFTDPYAAATRCEMRVNGQEHWKYAGSKEKNIPAVALGSIRSEGDAVVSSNVIPFHSTGSLVLGKSDFGSYALPLDDLNKENAKLGKITYMTPEFVLDQTAITAEISALHAPRFVYRFETTAKLLNDGRLESSAKTIENATHPVKSVVSAFNTMTGNTQTVRTEFGVEWTDDMKKWHALGNELRKWIAYNLQFLDDGDAHKATTEKNGQSSKKIKEKTEGDRDNSDQVLAASLDTFGSIFFNTEWASGKGALSMHTSLARNPTFDIRAAKPDAVNFLLDGLIRSQNVKIDKAVIESFVTFVSALQKTFPKDDPSHAATFFMLQSFKEHTEKGISFLKEEGVLVESENALTMELSSVGYNITINGKQMRFDQWVAVFAKYATHKQ